MSVTHQRVLDFHTARMSRDPAIIASFLHDDVEWSIAGPIDIIPFCGQRHGKDAAIDAIVRLAPSLFTVTKLEHETLIVDGDCAAGCNKLTAVQKTTGRTLSYRRAEFFVFRDDKIVSYRAILDSFDIAEQVLGHPIDLSIAGQPSNVFGNLIVA